ncbi:MAG: glycoside hydrolase family 3 N-terminal domain-containing protein [Clostridiaceae bacterium]|nr:glycoside hydrolase family 3 N-terminal domain-containing protein [Clostridiaceae bacterium]
MEQYKDQSLPFGDRAEDLLSRMTLKEKVGQLNQKMRGWKAYEKKPGGYEISDEFIKEAEFGDGIGSIYGLFRADPVTGVDYHNGVPKEDRADVLNRLQRYIMENTRLGIPILIQEDAPHGHMALDGTLFPTNIGIGSTWNPQLYSEVMACVAAEVAASGAKAAMISCLDILQDPRWGRSEECFGEDPFLSASFTAALVRGAQGLNPEDISRQDKIISIVKHFCGQGAALGGHNGKIANIGERELHEIHLPPMEAAVKAGTRACLAAYNEIDGIQCHTNKKLLTKILRERWGYEGLIISDGGAVDQLADLFGGPENAVAAAFNAGLEINLWNAAYEHLEDAAAHGKVKLEVIDRAVRRILMAKFETGLFDHPFTEPELAGRVVGCPAFRAVNYRAACECPVLLKNEHHLLPLSKSIRRLAVIGPNADNFYNQLGDYTAPQRDGGMTVLKGIRRKLPDAQVLYAQGCAVRNPSKEGFPQALAAAGKSELTILVLGGSSTRGFSNQYAANGAAIVPENPERPLEMDCGEGLDVAGLELGGVQLDLAKEIIALGKPVVVVLIQGRPHAIPWLAEHCQAILCGWYPGQEGGAALADILFGDVNPSGKLTVSIPRSSGQLPVYYNHKPYNDYVDMKSSPLYPFGFGLSYTRFAYSNLRLDQPKMSASDIEKGQKAVISVDIKNTGAVAGAETAQLYIHDCESCVSRRVRELKGFEKITLQPGETKTVVFTLSLGDLGVWNEDMEFVLEPGTVQIFVGSSSADAAQIDLVIEGRLS